MDLAPGARSDATATIFPISCAFSRGRAWTPRSRAAGGRAAGTARQRLLRAARRHRDRDQRERRRFARSDRAEAGGGRPALRAANLPGRSPESESPSSRSGPDYTDSKGGERVAACPGLREYDRRRDFDRTPEPRGDRAGRKRSRSKAAPPLQFVVQQHAARSMHWDFRLELDGVLEELGGPQGPEPRRRSGAWPCRPRTTRSNTPDSRA
jgi:hypothetical protein